MNKMKEQIISFKTAKLAKEKNFYCNNYRNFYANPGSKMYKIDEEGRTYSLSKRATKELYTIGFIVTLNAKNVIPVPTQSLLQKWLREKHIIHITIFSSSRERWTYKIIKKYQSLEEGLYAEIFYTYEEALEDALYKSLKLIKTK